MSEAIDKASLMIVRAAVGKQMELIGAGRVDELKTTFTDRLQDRVTAERLERAQAQLRSMTIDDLVASVAITADGLKVKMKNGRTLTTFVSIGGQWKADTIWFR